jgi:hypothetical protein
MQGLGLVCLWGGFGGGTISGEDCLSEALVLAC